jgi:HEAT repeat protein
MFPVALLTPLVLATAGLWVVVGLIVLVDRARYEARMDRLASARAELARSNPTLEEHARNVARQIGTLDFQQLVLDGLPRSVETALAREVRVRAGDDRVRRRAEGSESADVWQRIAALQVLASSGEPDAYPALDRALRSGSAQLAAAAIRMLTTLGSRDSAGVLINALRDGAYSRARLAAAIDRLPGLGADSLSPLFESSDPSARFWGARLAGRFNARQWAPAVRRLLDDNAALVRRAAVEALAVIGDPSDRDLLMARLCDPTPFVRAHAARASANFPDPEVARALVKLLSDREWIVRASARQGLRTIGRPAVDPLVRAMWDDDRFAANSAAEVLYLTGTIAELARLVLAAPTIAVEPMRVIQRYMAVAGPHLDQALLGTFSDGERIALLRHVDARVAAT